MQNSSTSDDKNILALLQNNDEKAMERIFDAYYPYLVNTAYHVLMDGHQAKDLVQDVLFHFWERRESIKIESGLKSYLRRAVVNKSIDQIRRKKRFGSTEEFNDFNQASSEASSQDLLETSDLKQVILSAITGLPERCKLVFTLSRFEDLSHNEIAEQLDISKKTIENQMTKALKTIRLAIQHYKKVSIFIIAFFFG